MAFSSVVLIPRPEGVYAQGRIVIGDIAARVPNFTSLVDFRSNADPIVSVYIRTPDFPTDSDAVLLRSVGASSVVIVRPESELTGVMPMQFVGRLAAYSRFVTVRVAAITVFLQP